MSSEPYTATDAINVLREANKNMAKRYMTFYFVNPAANMLKNGPLGFNVLMLETSESSVAAKVCPRFACVLVSFFAEISQDIALDMMNRWQNVFGNIQEICFENPQFMIRVEKGVNKVVRHYAKDAFRFIDSLQVLCKLKRRYKPLSDIKSFLNSFFRDVEIRIERMVESEMTLLLAEQTLALIWA